jgi:hypothetical protein
VDEEETVLEAVDVVLPNGAHMYVAASDIDGGGATKTAVAEYDFDSVVEALKGLSEVVRGAFASAAPTKTTVKIGIELSVKAGKLTALLVGGGAKGALDVTLEWDREGSGSER